MRLKLQNKAFISFLLKLWCLLHLKLCPPTFLPSAVQDSDIQKKIDHEIRMRDGACKLLAACSQKDQALEAAKSLQTCSTRIMAYMSELQRLKEAQVMQQVTRRSSDAGPMDDRLPCKGRVAISGKSNSKVARFPASAWRHGWPGALM